MEEAILDKFKLLISKKIDESIKTQNNIDFSVDMDGDEGDEVQGSIILDMAYAYNDRNNKVLADLILALDKFKSGEFGLCEECGEEIGMRRLEVNPGAKLCIKCAEELEKELKQNKQLRYV